jgi:thiol-disulfide isomerase/thioredoxin
MRLPVFVGLVAGLLAGVLVLVLVAASLGPVRPVATPTLAPPTTTPGAAPATIATDVTAAPPSRSPTGPPTGTAVGDRAPALHLPTVDGGSLDLAALGGKPAWVNFTASWCPSCLDELGFMRSAQAELGDRLSLVVVDVKEDRDTASRLAAVANLKAPFVLDTDGKAAAAWSALVLPVHVFVDGHGIVRDVVYGAAPPDSFVRGVASVLPGASLAP